MTEWTFNSFSEVAETNLTKHFLVFLLVYSFLNIIGFNFIFNSPVFLIYMISEGL